MMWKDVDASYELRQIIFIVSFLAIFMKPVLTKWTTPQQGTKGDVAHWTRQRSMEIKVILQGSNEF